MSNREKDSVISILQETMCIHKKKRVKDLKDPQDHVSEWYLNI